MNLWIEWFRCVRELRTACSRKRTFVWMCPGTGSLRSAVLPYLSWRGHFPFQPTHLLKNVHRTSDRRVRAVDGSGVGVEDPSCRPFNEHELVIQVEADVDRSEQAECYPAAHAKVASPFNRFPHRG